MNSFMGKPNQFQSRTQGYIFHRLHDKYFTMLMPRLIRTPQKENNKSKLQLIVMFIHKIFLENVLYKRFPRTLINYYYILFGIDIIFHIFTECVKIFKENLLVLIILRFWIKISINIYKSFISGHCCFQWGMSSWSIFVTGTLCCQRFFKCEKPRS